MALLLLCSEPTGASVLLLVPVTYSSPLFLCFPRSPSPPTSLSFSPGADSWSPRGGLHVCFRERCGKKRGAENKEQDRWRISPRLSACLLVVFWLTLSVWSLEFSFQFLSSDVKEKAHCKAGSIIDKRQRALYIFFLNIHPSSWRVLLHMRHQ